MATNGDRKTARQIRLYTIRDLYKNGYLEMDDAVELLKGPLTPGDDSTIIDDSDLLNDSMAFEKIASDEDKSQDKE